MIERKCESTHTGPYGMSVTIGWVQRAPGHAALEAVVTMPDSQRVDCLTDEETKYVTSHAKESNGRHAFEMYAEIYHDMIN